MFYHLGLQEGLVVVEDVSGGSAGWEEKVLKIVASGDILQCEALSSHLRLAREIWRINQFCES